jgi:mercuric ion transport protein
MVALRSRDPAIAAADPPAPGRGEVGRQRLIVVGGILGALAASSCCIVPLVLFGLGIGGAWIGNLTALAPYKPFFVTAAAGLLGYGFYLVHRKPRRACADGAACARPFPGRIVQLGLWIAMVIVVVAFAFDYVAPLLLRG